MSLAIIIFHYLGDVGVAHVCMFKAAYHLQG